MKGVILAGGKGSRLLPITRSLNKHLCHIYDKPMVYYPLSTLMLAGVREVALVSGAESVPQFQALLGDGSEFGINISYITQDVPGGIPHGFASTSDWLAGEPACLILGDNLFHGPSLGRALSQVSHPPNATVFGFQVSNPQDYAVIDFRGNSFAVEQITEKPPNPQSNWVIPGLYFLPPGADAFCLELLPSQRGEVEIVDLLRVYLNDGCLVLNRLPRGVTWFDVGTVQALNDASLFVRLIQERSGTLVGSPEEASWSQGWISDENLETRVNSLGETDYAQHLGRLIGL